MMPVTTTAGLSATSPSSASSSSSSSDASSSDMCGVGADGDEVGADGVVRNDR